MFTRLWRTVHRSTTNSVLRSHVQLILRMASTSTASVEVTVGTSSASVEVKLPTSIPKNQPMQFYRRPLPTTCIDFASDEGKKIFAEALAAGYMNAFFKLCSQFRTQDEPAYCGLTSLVMALNVLEIDPGRIWKGPWRWYHEEMLDCCTPLDIAKQKGINLEQFVCLARCNNLKATTKYAFDINSVDELREEVKRAATRDDIVFVASYSRTVLGQTGSGHFSPVAGYHEGRDLVLILDTARFKYPPHWIPLKVLLDAMRTVDSETGQPRGYVLLSSAKNQPGLLLFRPSCAFSIDTERGSLCSPLLDFAKEWEQFQGSMIKVPSERESIVQLAMEQMLKLKSQNNQLVNMFCLTLPCMNREDVTGYFVECQQPCTGLKEVTCAIKNILTEMESLETFKIVKEYLVNKLADKKEIFLKLIQQKDDCIESHLHKDEKEMSCCSTICCSKTSTQSDLTEPVSKMAKLAEGASNCSNCDGLLKIGPEHAVTLFFQVWPHGSFFFRDSSSTSSATNNMNTNPAAPDNDLSKSGEQSDGREMRMFSALLMEFIASDLGKSGQHVREEISTIKFKVREVLRYHSQGKSSKSCCRNTVL